MVVPNNVRSIDLCCIAILINCLNKNIQPMQGHGNMFSRHQIYDFSIFIDRKSDEKSGSNILLDPVFDFSNENDTPLNRIINTHT